MKSFIKKLVDNREQQSLSASLRQKRFLLFQSLIKNLSTPISILDVGGVERFWEVMSFVDIPDVTITLLNLTKPDTTHKNMVGLAGDATNMRQFEENQFDVVFSNSVIEHVGSYSDQERMAKEVQRVGKHYFLQTPNFFFPIEPHFLFPGFQWLPISVRIFLIRHFDLGWNKKISDPSAAKKLIEDTRLLKKHELMALFPTANLYEEKVLGLTKSFIVYDNLWQ